MILSERRTESDTVFAVIVEKDNRLVWYGLYKAYETAKRLGEILNGKVVIW